MFIYVYIYIYLYLYVSYIYTFFIIYMYMCIYMYVYIDMYQDADYLDSHTLRRKAPENSVGTQVRFHHPALRGGPHRLVMSLICAGSRRYQATCRANQGDFNRLAPPLTSACYVVRPSLQNTTLCPFQRERD